MQLRPAGSVPGLFPASGRRFPSPGALIRHKPGTSSTKTPPACSAEEERFGFERAVRASRFAPEQRRGRRTRGQVPKMKVFEDPASPARLRITPKNDNIGTLRLQVAKAIQNSQIPNQEG